LCASNIEKSANAQEVPVNSICDLCQQRSCKQAGATDFPTDCPSCQDFQKDAREAYKPGGPDHELARAASITIKYGYGKLTRVEETMVFAHEMGFQKIGVAFCTSLEREARTFCQVLRDNGFMPVTVMCKNGAVPIDTLEEPYLDTLASGMCSSICNPVGQALTLNAEHTELNVVLGLCVGHDALFIKHSEAAVTYLGVKDRVTGHHPLTPLYLHEGLFKRIHHVIFRDENRS
jgi:uncharacterized metal-binding protein